ncbi:helix-turn-helix domain-containing protein [Actinomadura terrae]|uniref:helix-turn-helix domain-containing protein n=1 Tax=Actinomadura terrae TaxID=604353 RepID=UPI001FA77BF1|nr:hypothetical protein [Actinomadura terrae]
MKRKPNVQQVVPEHPDELARELERRRDLEAARRADELARVRAEAGHGRARADVREESTLVELARAEREADVRAKTELSRMYRQFRAAGERTRLTSEMARSGEARALGLTRLRVQNLKVLVPVLLGFAAWSTTGVQQGAARLMNADTAAPTWWALWILEPVLIGAVVWIIVARARLAASGGEIAEAAIHAAIGFLTTSIFLNLAAAVPDVAPEGGWGVSDTAAVLASMLAHAVAPVGAAVTAHLIGLIDTSISDADPWHDKDGQDVPRLAEMDLNLPTGSAAAPALETDAVGDGQGDAEAVPVTAWPVRVGERRALPLVSPPQSEPVIVSLPHPGREPHVDDYEQDEQAGGERLEYTGPLTQEEESETSAPWRREPPAVREAIARVLGEDVVRGAEQYLTEQAENPGALRELPPPAKRRERPERRVSSRDEQAGEHAGERPVSRPDERPGARAGEQAGTWSGPAHKTGGDLPGGGGNEQPDERGQERAVADPRARLAAVRALLAREPELSSSQISERLGMPHSTARRLAAQVRREQDGGERR